MVCHVNRFNTISLIVRDNLDEQFVIKFNIGDIEITPNPKLQIGSNENTQNGIDNPGALLDSEKSPVWEIGSGRIRQRPRPFFLRAELS